MELREKIKNRIKHLMNIFNKQHSIESRVCINATISELENLIKKEIKWKQVKYLMMNFGRL